MEETQITSNSSHHLKTLKAVHRNTAEQQLWDDQEKQAGRLIDSK
jgi:hypothetical protein